MPNDVNTEEIARLRTEINTALDVLAPSMRESGIVDACKQRMQAYISERGNREKLEAEVAHLKARLEIDHWFDVDGNRVDGTLPESADGIACRDVTIAMQKEEIDNLRARIEHLHNALLGKDDKVMKAMTGALDDGKGAPEVLAEIALVAIARALGIEERK